MGPPATDTEGQYGPLYGVYRTLTDAAMRFDSPAAYLRYRALGALTGAMELLDALIDDDDLEATPEAVKAYDLCGFAVSIFEAKTARERDDAIAAAQAYCTQISGGPVDLSKPVPEAFRREAKTAA